MRKQTKISYFFLLAFCITTIVHVVYVSVAARQTSALVFLGFLVFCGFIISLLVNVFTYLRHGKPQDIWKLGWIGLLGLIGFIPGIDPVFFGLYGFFGFFGFKPSSSR